MAENHPVTALEELAKSKELAPPIYCFEEIEGPKFKCTVEVGGKTFEGVATGKRLAMYVCAEIALEELQIIAKSQNTTNYIGDLNIYASKNHVDYPVYECFATTKTGEFIVNCSFLGCQALGKGQNQKEAKQNAARNMLELYVSQGKCEFDAQKNDEKVEKITDEEKSGDVSNAKEDASGTNAKVEEENENSVKSEVIGWGPQDFEEVLTRIKTIGLNRGQVVQKNDDNEEDNKNVLGEESGEVTKKKNNKAKSKKKKNKKSEINLNDFGIPDHVIGVNTEEQIRKKGDEESKMESDKEESGIISKAKKEESNKSGLDVQSLAKIIAGINTFALNRREDVQKVGNEEDNKNVEEEENGDVSKKNKIKTKKKKSQKSEVNFIDFGIQDLTSGDNNFSVNTGEDIQKKDDAEGNMKSVKEESGVISKMNKEEGNKSVLNDLGAQDLAEIIAGISPFALNTGEDVQKESYEKVNKNIAEEESNDVSKAKKKAAKAKTKKKKSKKSEGNGFGVQDLEKVVSGINRGLNTGIEEGKMKIVKEDGDVSNKAKKEESNKNEINGLGTQDLAKIIAGILNLKKDNEDHKKYVEVSKAKKKAIQPNEVETKKNVVDAFGIQDLEKLVAGIDREDIQKKSNEQGKKTVKEESGNVVKAKKKTAKTKVKKDENKKSEVNDLGFPGISTHGVNTGENIQKKGDEEGKKETVKDKSDGVSKGKKKAGKTKTKKEEIKKSDDNGLGVQDLQKIVAGINTLGENSSKPNQIHIVINLPR